MQCSIKQWWHKIAEAYNTTAIERKKWEHNNYCYKITTPSLSNARGNRLQLRLLIYQMLTVIEQRVFRFKQ